LKAGINLALSDSEAKFMRRGRRKFCENKIYR
jgi:hypothetical protein